MTPEVAEALYNAAVARQSHRPHIAFTIHGPPVGKQRARIDKDGGHTPTKTRQYEKHVKGCASAALLQWQMQRRAWQRAEWWPTAGEVYCDLWIHMGKGPWPDPGNVSKAVVDACSGVLWVSSTGKGNDNRVLERQQARVEYSPEPRVDVLVHFVELER